MYIIIAIAMTLYLIAYNNFEFSTFGSVTIIPANRIEGFGNTSLIIAKKDLAAVNEGDKILFYNSYEAKSEIIIEEVLSKKVEYENEITFFLESERFLSSTYLIGKHDELVKIPYLGTLVNFLSLQSSFFVFIIMPSFSLLFLGGRELYYIKKGRR